MEILSIIIFWLLRWSVRRARVPSKQNSRNPLQGTRRSTGSARVMPVVNSSIMTRQIWVRPNPPVILSQKVKPKANKSRIRQGQTLQPKLRTRKLLGNATNRLKKLKSLLKKANWVAKRTQWKTMWMIRAQTVQMWRCRYSNAKFAHRSTRQTSY